jgi:glycosyltransferase A (GT-A) superfamily protein (DUF2064 family)
MTALTLVPHARRPARRQAALACACGAYLAAVVAAALGLAAIALPTAALALAAAMLATGMALAAGALWALDEVEARRRPPAPVVALRSGRSGRAPVGRALTR